MVVDLGPDEIHVLEPGLPVDPQALAVLGKETEALPEQKNRDQRQHHDGHNRIATEKGLDRIVQGQPEQAQAPFLNGECGGCSGGVGLAHAVAEQDAVR